MNPIIVTHVSPDLDAIASAWLLKRFDPHFFNADVAFVNTGNPDIDLLMRADAVVDTGRVLHPFGRRYDHHQMENPNQASAAMLVWQDLMFLHSMNQFRYDVTYLKPLIELVHAGDCGLPEADESRKKGIHAVVSEMKFLKYSDEQILDWGFKLLDSITTALREGYSLESIMAGMPETMWGKLYITPALERAERLKVTGIQPYVAYRSNDGRFVALKDAPQGATQLAFEDGAELVLWSNYAENAIGINRARGSSVQVGELVDSLQNSASDAGATILYAELATWYRHNSGFFSGRGTAKAPREDVIALDFTDLALAFDAIWER